MDIKVREVTDVVEKSKQQIEQEQQQATLLQQAGQFANSKLADTENLQGMMPGGQEQPPQEPE